MDRRGFLGTLLAAVGGLGSRSGLAVEAGRGKRAGAAGARAGRSAVAAGSDARGGAARVEVTKAV